MRHMRPVYEDGVLRGLEIPSLSAYAIEYSELFGPPSLDAGHIEYVEGRDFYVEKGCVVLAVSLNAPPIHGALEDADIRFSVHYHGIRDFGLLFPQVAEDTLRRRLGNFYEEAERVFDVAAWLSFALNAAAIYEGLLGWRLGRARGTLEKFTEEALELGVIDETARCTIDVARHARNLVHASHHKKPFISRTDAMDMRMVMDKLIREFSIQTPERR
jgi:hypothetical protein